MKKSFKVLATVMATASIASLGTAHASALPSDPKKYVVSLLVYTSPHQSPHGTFTLSLNHADTDEPVLGNIPRAGYTNKFEYNISDSNSLKNLKTATITYNADKSSSWKFSVTLSIKNKAAIDVEKTIKYCAIQEAVLQDGSSTNFNCKESSL